MSRKKHALSTVKMILILFIAFSFNAGLYADTTYVDPSSSFTGDGSFSSPFNSWTFVQWRSGNTYLQKRGTVSDETIEIGSSGTTDAYVIVGAYGNGEKPVIETNEKVGIKMSNRSYVHIKDLHIITTGQSKYWATSGIYGMNGESNIIENVEIGPAAGHGIYLQNNNNLHVKHCLFYNTGTKDEWDSCDNIHLENCHDYLVEYCVSYNALQGAVYDASDGGSGYTTGTWRYNIGYRTPDSKTERTNWSIFKMSGHHAKSTVELLYNIAYGSFHGPAYALQEELVSTAIGNVAYDCVAGFQNVPDTNTIINNIVMNCNDVIYFPQGNMPSQMDYNIFYNNNRFGYIANGALFPTLEDYRNYSGLNQHSILDNPMFTDAENHDFTLQNNSPAIDAGKNLGSPYDSALYAFSEWTDNVILVNQNNYGNGWEIGPYVFKPVVYIDPSLPANGNGSINKPFNSWDQVQWLPGYTYLQKRGTTWDKKITIDGSGEKNRPIIVGSYGEGQSAKIITSSEHAIEMESVSHVYIRDLSVITLSSGDASGLHIAGAKHIALENIQTDSTVSHGVYIKNSDSVSIKGCHIQEAGYTLADEGIDNIHLDTCHYFLVESVVSSDCFDGSAIDVNGGTGTIRYNRIYNSEGHTQGNALININNTGDVAVVYNQVYGASESTGMSLLSKTYAYNNTIFNCNQGIRSDHAESSLINNILSDNETGLVIETLPATADFNLYFDNSNDVHQGTQNMTLDQWQNSNSNQFGQNSVSGDPKFNDPQQADFTLQSGSQAIDNGYSEGQDFSMGLKSNASIPDSIITIDQNQYGAGWEMGAYVFINQYSLTVQAENGQVTPDSGTFYEGTEVEVSAAADSGYVFTGWSGDLTGDANPVTIAVDSNISLTANFVQGFALITNASNGTVEPSEGTFLEGSEVTLTANPDNDFHFEKWSGDVTGTENPLTFIMDSDKEITAHFYQTYQLNITAENGTVEPGSGEYKANTQLELEATPDEGYKFLAWNGPVSGILNPITFTLNRDMDIIAIFQALEEYSLTIRTDNGTVTPQSGTYYEGDTVRLAVKADSGYVFSNWSGDVQDTSETIEIIMNRNYTMEANFTKITSVWSDIKGNSPEVYPNPVNDKLRIEMTTQADIHEPCQLTLYDVLGKIKFSQNIDGSSVIDVSKLKKGIYILQLKKENENLMHKMIIKE